MSKVENSPKAAALSGQADQEKSLLTQTQKIQADNLLEQIARNNKERAAQRALEYPANTTPLDEPYSRRR